MLAAFTRRDNVSSILLIDDHAMFREGIALTIGRAMPEAVIHAASTGKEAMAVLNVQPDIEVVMMDFYLPDIAGSVLLRYLRQLRRGLRILVVSASEDPVDVHRALTAGAHGFLHKTADSRCLLDALGRVSAGQDYVPEAFALAGKNAMRPDDAALLGTLTPRQTEVLRLVCEGLRNGEISTRLGMTEKTVKAHMSAILAALDVPNRTQATVIARRGGLLGKLA
jgi:DNA-binding NarL/FixJ family response regulator